MSQVIDFEKSFPIMSVENDCVISKRGEVSVLFELYLPEVFTISYGEYNLMHETWCKVLRMLPAPTVVHKQDFYYTEKYDSTGRKYWSLLDEHYWKNFDGRIYLKHKCYLYLTKTNMKQMEAGGIASMLTSKNYVGSKVSPGEQQKFLDAVEQFESVLNDSKVMRVRRLTTDEIVGTPGKPGLYDLLFSLGGLELGDVEFGSDLDEDRIKVGNNLVSIHAITSLDQLPAEISPQQESSDYSTSNTSLMVSTMFPLGLGLKKPHILNQYIYLTDSEKKKEEVEARQKGLIAMSQLFIENRVNAGFCQDFLEDMRINGVRAVECHCNVMIWSEDNGMLKNNGLEIAKKLASISMTAKVMTLDAPIVFWAAIPGNGGDLPHEELFLTGLEQGVCLFASESNTRDTTSPFYISLCDRLTGTPVKIDISDKPYKDGTITNKNKFILGPSGSGKSFFTNHMVRQYYDQGAHILIVDIGHSYQYQCEIINERTRGEDGLYFTATEDDPISFNPFFAKHGSFDQEQIDTISSIISFLWKMGGTYMPSEKKFVDQSILEYLRIVAERDNGKGNFNGYYEYLRDEFRENLSRSEIEVKVSDFDLGNMLHTLSQFYVGGRYDRLLNSDVATDIFDKRFVIFELDNIKNNPILLPLTTIIIMDAYMSKVKRINGKKILIIEEAWKAIMNDKFAEYIKGVFKTVRKYDGEAIVVTQELDDLLGSDIIKDTVVSQSDCKILLDQKKYLRRFEDVRDFLGLSNQQQAEIFSINTHNDYTGRNQYREVWIGLGSNFSGVYATEVSDMERMCFGTNASEKYEIESIKKELGATTKQAIVEYIKRHKVKPK